MDRKKLSLLPIVVGIALLARGSSEKSRPPEKHRSVSAEIVYLSVK